MRELRALANRISEGYRDRDELLYELARSGSLSRHDIATATGLHRTRVDQIIRELSGGRLVGRAAQLGRPPELR